MNEYWSGKTNETKWKHKNDLFILKLFDFVRPINNVNANNRRQGTGQGEDVKRIPGDYYLPELSMKRKQSVKYSILYHGVSLRFH